MNGFHIQLIDHIVGAVDVCVSISRSFGSILLGRMLLNYSFVLHCLVMTAEEALILDIASDERALTSTESYTHTHTLISPMLCFCSVRFSRPFLRQYAYRLRLCNFLLNEPRTCLFIEQLKNEHCERIK